MNLKWETCPSALLYTPLFLFRRLIFSISVVFLDQYALVQIFLLIIQSLLVLCYLLHVRPFSDRSISLLEIFNEICIYLVAFPVLMFKDITDNTITNYNLGWMIVFCVLVNILVNMIVMVVINLKGARQICKRWNNQRK
jgi:hypothetical protein